MTEQVVAEQLQPSAVPAAPPPAPPAEVQPDQKPAVEAPAEAPATDAQPEKHSGRFERRISKLYRKLGEADARAAALQKELETFKTPKAPDGAPKLEQFDDIEKYADAKAEFAKSQALKDYESKQRTNQQQQQSQKLTAEWEEKATAAEGKYDDFDEVVGELRPTNTLTAAIMREENGADVAYHLGKNPKEAMRIAGLEPIDQILAIGRLAAKLSMEPPVAKTPSKAPPPINPVSGRATAPSDEISEEDDMKTFIRKRERQIGRRK